MPASRGRPSSCRAGGPALREPQRRPGPASGPAHDPERRRAPLAAAFVAELNAGSYLDGLEPLSDSPRMDDHALAHPDVLRLHDFSAPTKRVSIVTANGTSWPSLVLTTTRSDVALPTIPIA